MGGAAAAAAIAAAALAVAVARFTSVSGFFSTKSAMKMYLSVVRGVQQLGQELILTHHTHRARHLPCYSDHYFLIQLAMYPKTFVDPELDELEPFCCPL